MAIGAVADEGFSPVDNAMRRAVVQMADTSELVSNSVMAWAATFRQ